MSRFRRRSGERGAVLVIFAAFVIVAVLMLAFVVDIGGLRQEKKEVTLSTDAAALAVAAELDLRTFAAGTYDCVEVPVKSGGNAQTLATSYLLRNGNTVDDGCRIEVTGPRRGYVVIGGQEDVEYAFSGAVGQDFGTVRGVSASVARVDSGGGLRPIGLCSVETTINVDGSGNPYSMQDDVLNGPRDDDGYLDTRLDMVIALDHLVRDASCSVGAPGQRGQLDLDPSAFGNGGTNRCSITDPDPSEADAGYFTTEYRYGYFGPIEQWTPTDSGADFGGLDACFDRDIAEEQLIWLPIFDQYQPPPDSRMRIIAFAQAQLTGYCLSPAEYAGVPPTIDCLADVPGEPPPGKSWLRFTVSRVVDFDEAGPPLTDDSLKDSPAICAEKDDMALLAACVPPNPPPLGSPGDPTPPPQPACQLNLLASVTPSDITITLGGSGGNKTPASPPVAYEVFVLDPLGCVESEIAVRAVPPSGATRTLNVSGPNGLGRFDAVLAPGTQLQHGTTYTIEVTVGVQSDTSAKLHTTASP